MATPRTRTHFIIALVASFIESLKRDMVGEAGAVTDPQHDHGGATGSSGTGATGAGSAHTHAFTGTQQNTAAVELVNGTGYTTAGQVVTSTENFSLGLNEYAGCWLIPAAGTPCLIASHPAVAAAPAAFTVYGAAPPTDAGGYKIFRAPTPQGTNGNESAHTHTGPAHTHTVAAGATGVTVAGGGTAIHYDQAEYAVSTANASDLATSIALTKALVYAYLRHAADTLAHTAADATNVLDEDAATVAAAIVDLSSAISAANALKAAYNAHRSQSGVHPTNDSGHQVTSSNATDQSSLNTLLNEMKGDLNAHMAAGLSTPSWRVED